MSPVPRTPCSDRHCAYVKAHLDAIYLCIKKMSKILCPQEDRLHLFSINMKKQEHGVASSRLKQPSNSFLERIALRELFDF